ncbi:MAG: arginine--tRNA ligase [Parachlamydiaceae bacterium]
MKTIFETLQKKFADAIVKAYPTTQGQDTTVEVVQSTQDKFGHYQCNSAMKLAKLVGAKPRDIAQQLVTSLDKNDGHGNQMIAHLEIAGPGFINITIDPQFLSHFVTSMARSARLAIDLPEKKQRIIIDFSSPNTAKEMHVGHLRSTIIGDCLARLFEFLGHDVLRLNHIGDWGTAFGMLIAFMKEQAPHVLTGNETTDLTHLVAWYKAAKQKFDADPDFRKSSQMEVVSLQGGDPTALKAWTIICDISRKAYQEIYDLLDIKIIERGESFYNPMLAGTVADLEAKGLVTVSDGAKCIFLEGFQNREGNSLPLMVQKSDGGYNYDTTDMAAIRQRIDVEKGDRLIYVTDAGQNQHFRMVFAAAEKAGYLDPKKVRVDHVPFGLVLGNDGKKFRTRSGDTERLADLLYTAIEQANAILIERSPETSEDERKSLAKALGIGAIKYADLSCHRVGDYVFSYERMLRFEGNTAAFLMYAYVRVAGIKRKVKDSADILASGVPIVLEHPSEIALGMHLAQFGETLNQVAEELLPNRLTDYLYVLAEKFNAFFRDCRVEGSPQQSSRLLLCEASARIMKQGLEILGLHTVEKM